MVPAADKLQRYRPIIDDWAAFVKACERPLPLVVWANPLRAEALRRLNLHDGVEAAEGGGPESMAPAPGEAPAAARAEDSAKRSAAGAGAAADLLAARLRARGYHCERLAWHAGAMKVTGLDKPGLTLEYLIGLYHVQEEASLIPAEVLAPQPGERILDLCAAPGGKTAQMSVATACRGTIVANDVRIDRIRALRGNVERLGLLNVAMTAQDGTGFPLDAGPFDAVLLDAPCSCEGNVRQGSGVPYAPPEAGVSGRSGLQATLLGRAWKMLAPGGRLVYATCTFAPEENEIVLDYALGDDARIEPVALPGLQAAPGVTEWQGRALRPDCARVVRYWPHFNDTGGFTVALVRKRAAS